MAENYSPGTLQTFYVAVCHECEAREDFMATDYNTAADHLLNTLLWGAGNYWSAGDRTPWLCPHCYKQDETDNCQPSPPVYDAFCSECKGKAKFVGEAEAAAKRAREEGWTRVSPPHHLCPTCSEKATQGNCKYRVVKSQGGYHRLIWNKDDRLGPQLHYPEGKTFLELAKDINDMQRALEYPVVDLTKEKRHETT